MKNSSRVSLPSEVLLDWNGDHRYRTNRRSHLHNSDQQVMGMVCQLLFSRFKNEATMARVEEKISDAHGNRSAHHAGAFKLGLRTVLDLEEQSPQAGVIDGVMLRCRSSTCSGNKEQMPYSFAGSHILCPRCGGYYMQCTGCRAMRTDIYPSCSFCKKRFA